MRHLATSWPCSSTNATSSWLSTQSIAQNTFKEMPPLYFPGYCVGVVKLTPCRRAGSKACRNTPAI